MSDIDDYLADDDNWPEVYRSGQTFTFSIDGTIDLTLKQIWPDGDAPENPTAADVVQVVQKYAPLEHWLRDWSLEQDVRVDIYSAGDIERDAFSRNRPERKEDAKSASVAPVPEQETP